MEHKEQQIANLPAELQDTPVKGLVASRPECAGWCFGWYKLVESVVTDG